MEELISKKELLRTCNISYGQLYRWKRKNLIPEEWFIRKSTYTGQEAFFPRAKMVERVEQIKKLKDQYSLDELHEMFTTPHASEESHETTLNTELFSERVVTTSEPLIGNRTTLTQEEGLKLAFIEYILDKGMYSRSEINDAVLVLTHTHLTGNMTLTLLRSYGAGIFIVSEGLYAVSDEAKVIDTITVEQLQMNLNIIQKRGK